MNRKIKAWYLTNHPGDGLGANIDARITFEELWEGLKNGVDVYKMLGVCDSWIREIVFNELAKRLSVDYQVVYEAWLGVYE